jgi:membrane-associated phospholipid phosphatase
MLQGAHYLSDIVFAALFASLTVLILRELLLDDGCFARPLNAALRRLKLA